MNIKNEIRSAIANYQAGKLQEAESILKKILNKLPNDADILYLLGIIYAQTEKFDLAIRHITKSLQFNTKNVEAYLALALALYQKGLPDEAIIHYRKVINLDPNHAEAYNGLGSALRAKGELAEAMHCFKKALQINAKMVEAYNNWGECLFEQWNIDDAISLYKQAIQISPTNISAYVNIGNAFNRKGNPIEAEKYYRQAVQIDSNNIVPYQSLLTMMNYSSTYNAKQILEEKLKFAKRFEEPLSASISSHNNDRSHHRRLKIGYVSPNFHAHVVSYFFEPVLSNHNKKEHEIFCYSLSSLEDAVTKHLREHADHWRNIGATFHENAAKIIRSDNIDILVDLAGFTTNNKILLFASKPAPLQLTWLGYLTTTGFSAFDYKITDSYSDPPGSTEEFYTEKLLRLPESFLCYQPYKSSPDVGPLPALSRRHITFGSFNNFLKVSHGIIAIWSKVLGTIPDSRLIMKSYNFYDRTAKQYAMDMFKQEGINEERIELLLPDPPPKHFESYNLVDIGLDTFPFNGGATTCEALWMGVPVITLAGPAYHSRTGVSLLSNVGLPELVAETPEEYISIAVSLANDLKRLQSLRERLRDMMKHSPLCDAKRFTENLEMCYRQIWEKWCESN